MALEPELEPAACGRRENHLAHNVANANGINNAGFPAGEDDQPSRLPDPPHSVPIRRRKVWHGYSRVWTTAVGRILGGKIQFVINHMCVGPAKGRTTPMTSLLWPKRHPTRKLHIHPSYAARHLSVFLYVLSCSVSLSTGTIRHIIKFSLSSF